MEIKIAVVPVAGLGTRLLPATKSQPKEMLPVGRKPVVQYVVEELARVGMQRILFITGPGKASIENHFDLDNELIQILRQNGKEDLLAELSFERAPLQYFYTRQRRQLGLGHAVACAQAFVGDQPFAVALGDSIIGLNAVPMRAASMAGPVYDVSARMLDLWSLVRVTDDNGGWMRYLLAAAAVTQIAEARLLAPVLAEAVGAVPATSEHPASGTRSVPGEMAFAAAAFVASGDEPCAWPESEFADAVSGYMNRPPEAVAGVEGHGVAIEFPFGDRTSLCRLAGDQPHPLYGNGLLVLQRFPVEGLGESEGIALALSLNAADLTREVTGYGLGSYSYDDGAIHFSGFVPNALHKAGLLRNLYASCAARAHAMAARFTEGDGTAMHTRSIPRCWRADWPSGGQPHRSSNDPGAAR